MGTYDNTENEHKQAKCSTSTCNEYKYAHSFTNATNHHLYRIQKLKDHQEHKDRSKLIHYTLIPPNISTTKRNGTNIDILTQNRNQPKYKLYLICRIKLGPMLTYDHFLGNIVYIGIL